MDEECLGEPWHAHKQYVTTREQSRHHVLHDIVLAHNAPAYLGNELHAGAREPVEQLEVALIVVRTDVWLARQNRSLRIQLRRNLIGGTLVEEDACLVTLVANSSSLQST